jgi:hypothetical protein
MGRTTCTEPQCLYSRAVPLLPLCVVRPVQSLSACTVELYLCSPYVSYGLYRASVPVQESSTSIPPMALTACTEPQFLYKGDLYLFNPLNAELNPICRLLILLGDLTFMCPCIVSISNKMQRYTVYLISGICSTCFGWYFHPSSGPHTTVSTASGICHTVTAI